MRHVLAPSPHELGRAETRYAARSVESGSRGRHRDARLAWVVASTESRVALVDALLGRRDPDSSHYTDNTVERRGPAGMLSAYTITP